MKVIYDLGKAISPKPTAIAIGIFDGVHRGHQALVKEMIKLAHAHKALPTVLTFYPHPAHVLSVQSPLRYITTLSKRLELLEDLGVKQVIVLPFDLSFAAIEPEYFIKHYLLEKWHAKAIIVGENFRFGKNRLGDRFLFSRLSQELGFNFKALPSVMAMGMPISSTRIRALILEGQLPQAKRLLGRLVEVEGKVVRGDGRGRKLGFPTANIDYHQQVLVPQGVYAVTLQWGKKIWPAVANVGIRPTFKPKAMGLQMEVHVFDHQLRLYHRQVRIAFYQQIRTEKTFASIEELKIQIKKDILQAKNLLTKHRAIPL